MYVYIGVSASRIAIIYAICVYIDFNIWLCVLAQLTASAGNDFAIFFANYKLAKLRDIFLRECIHTYM